MQVLILIPTLTILHQRAQIKAKNQKASFKLMRQSDIITHYLLLPSWLINYVCYSLSVRPVAIVIWKLVYLFDSGNGSVKWYLIVWVWMCNGKFACFLVNWMMTSGTSTCAFHLQWSPQVSVHIQKSLDIFSEISVSVLIRMLPVQVSGYNLVDAVTVTATLEAEQLMN